MRHDPQKFVGYGTTSFDVGGSSVSGPFGAVRFAGSGTVEGEETQDAEAFGAPGIICRPRPPTAEVTGLDGTKHYDVGMESVGLRGAESIRPIAYRDLRLNLKFPAPAAGTIGLVGYGGGFLSFSDDVEEQSIATLYVPYDFVGGVPTKCHTIILDPVEETVAIIQGDGRAIVLGPDGIVMRCDSTTHVNLAPGACTIVADKIILQGNVVAGANSVGALPLAPGVSSPSFFVSAV